MADPKYVRLVAARQLTMVADVLGGTGWSISGADVRPFPEGAQEKDYVRDLVRRGVLEGASKAEFEEVEERNKEAFDTEAELQAAAMEKAVARAEKAREAAADAEPEPAPEPPPNSGGMVPSEAEAADDIDSLTNEQLRERLSAAGESTSGNKAELQERLRALG